MTYLAPHIKHPDDWVEVSMLCPNCSRWSHKHVRRIGTTARFCFKCWHRVRVTRCGHVLRCELIK